MSTPCWVQLRPVFRIVVVVLSLLSTIAHGVVSPSSLSFIIHHGLNGSSHHKDSVLQLFCPLYSLPSAPPPSPQLVRGSHYGSDNNSTIPTAEQAAARVCVLPPQANASPQTWKRAWNTLKFALPILHWQKKYRSPDSKLALAVLWWKALAERDGFLAYDMLPSLTRRIVAPCLRRFYPRLHHANVEIRTAYLDQAIMNITKEIISNSTNHTMITHFRLVSLGAGYDVRSVKLLQRGIVQDAVELDLAPVIIAKTKLLERLKRRQEQRRRGPFSRIKKTNQASELKLPRLISLDLNDIDQVNSTLRSIVLQDKNPESANDTAPTTLWYNILLSEGVMIYLDPGIPTQLLQLYSRVLTESSTTRGCFVFADRLEDIPGCDGIIGQRVLKQNGWNLRDWQPKPGLARHMGLATLPDSFQERV